MSNHTSLSIPILNTQCSTLLMYVNIIIIAETDGSRQISPESPVKPMVGAAVPRKISSTTQEAASNAASIRLTLPPTRIRRTSEPHPRYIDIHSHACTHTHTHTQTLWEVLEASCPVWLRPEGVWGCGLRLLISAGFLPVIWLAFRVVGRLTSVRPRFYRFYSQSIYTWSSCNLIPSHSLSLSLFFFLSNIVFHKPNCV